MAGSVVTGHSRRRFFIIYLKEEKENGPCGTSRTRAPVIDTNSSIIIIIIIIIIEQIDSGNRLYSTARVILSLVTAFYKMYTRACYYIIVVTLLACGEEDGFNDWRIY